MEVRVLTRFSLRRLFSQSLQTHPSPAKKIRYFSKMSSLESPGNSQLTHQVSLANTLQKYGFPSSQLHEFIQKNRFLLNSSASDIQSCIKVLLSFGFSQKSLVSILSSCPRALDPVFLEKWQLGFAELGFTTTSPSMTQKVLEQCGRFRIEPEHLRQNALLMKAMGFRDRTVSRVFEELPAAFMEDPIDIGRRVEFLNRVGIERDEVDWICFSYPEFLAFSIEGRLRPLFEEIRDLGFSIKEVRSPLFENPRLVLGLEVGELSRCVELLKSLKCREPIKEKILSKGRLRAGLDVKLRVECLCSHGLIRRDALKVLFIEPRTILYELEDIVKKIIFLQNKIGFSIESLVEFPEYLGVNLEKQIIPRHNVIEFLRSKGGLGLEVDLKHLVKLSRLKFYNLFVKPYPECQEIFGGPVRESEAKARHPAGLWKLFKPQKFSDSEEDIRNMKHFMESIV